MAKILYAINGEGMGHVTRSTALIKELEKRHEIRIIVGSKRGHEYLRKHFPNIKRIEGLSLIYKENSVDNIATAKDFMKKVFNKTTPNFKAVYNTIKRFRPDIILTDFEGGTMYVSTLFKIPVVCICNVHDVTHLEYKIPKKYLKDYAKTNVVIRFLSPNIKYHLLTTFFYMPAKKKDTFVFPPILRKEIYNLKTSRKNHILVYQTSSTNARLVEMLKQIDYKFIIYGFGKDEKDGNLTYRTFNEKQFFKDFRECNACIANGGYSFISEAVSLHKPILCVPIEGQFEQILNAHFVKKLGYGEFKHKLTRQNIEHFIKNSGKYYKNLKDFKKEDNSRILAKIEEIIAKETARK